MYGCVTHSWQLLLMVDVQARQQQCEVTAGGLLRKHGPAGSCTYVSAAATASDQHACLLLAVVVQGMAIR
jgi:hypothetical protein